MGVKFFLKLLALKGYTKELEEMKNQYIVIDAPNFAYHICSENTKGYYYTWNDCDTSYIALIDILNNFKYCGLKPVFVFEDGLNIRNGDAAGIQRILDNARDIKKTVRKREDYSRSFARNILKRALRDLNIKWFTSRTGKHQAAAFLSQKLNCPILSNDSAFCIFNVDVIFLQSLIFCKTTKAFKSTIFDREKFLKEEGLSQDVLPIVAAVAGNEFTDSEFLEEIFGRRNINDMYSFLKGNTYEEAIQSIMRVCPEKHKAKMMEAVIKSAQHYTPVGSFNEQELWELLPDCQIENTIEPVEYAFEISPRLKTLFARGGLTMFYKLAAFNQLSIHRFLVNDNFPDIHILYLELFKGIYTFMQRNNENKLETTVAMSNTWRNVGYDKFRLHVLPELKIGPGKLTDAERVDIYYRILEFTEKDIKIVKEFPDDWQIFITTVLYVIKKRGIRPYQVHSVLVSAIITKVVQEKMGFYDLDKEAEEEATDCQDSAEEPSRIASLLSQINGDDCVLIRNAFSSHKFQSGTDTNRGPDLVAMHNVSGLLAGFQFVRDLTKIVGQPKLDFPVERFVCGSLIYHFLLKWKQSKKPEESAYDCLRDHSEKIYELYRAMVELLYQRR